MATDVKIRLVSEAQMTGFKEAEDALKRLEVQYKNTSDGTLTKTRGNMNKMLKTYTEILSSGKDNAQKMAGEYFQNWAKSMIYNFSGGDASKLRNQLEKAISAITDTGGSDNLANVNMTQLHSQIKEVRQLYDDMALDAETASQRKERAYNAEKSVLQSLGMEEQEYNLTMKYTKEQMLSLAMTGKQNTVEFQNLATAYRQASDQLDLYNKRANSGKNTQLSYLKSTAKSMIVHQDLAKVLFSVKQVLNDSSKLAGEAEQKFNKLSTVFEGLEKTARKSASAIADAIGVADSTASSALSTVGDLLQAQGMGVVESLSVAEDWVKKFSDIIAFKDIKKDLDTFASDVMAGFLGNTRNLRSIGAVVKDSAVQLELAKRGMDNLTGSELELAKMNIRAEMTFNQLANASGATKREWDSMLSVNRRLSEAWKEYEEAIGQGINKYMRPFKGWLAEILELQNDVTKNMKEIRSGEYTIKVEQETTPEYKKEIVSTLADYAMDTRKARQSGVENFGDSAFGTMGNYGWLSLFTGRKIASEELAGEEITKFAVDDFVKVMKATGATAQLVVDALDERYTSRGELNDEDRSSIISLLYEAQSIVNDWKNEESVRMGRKTTIDKASENFDSLTETLLKIAGVSFIPSSFTGASETFSGSDKGRDFILGEIKNWTINNFQSALDSISNAELSKWGDVISGALDELDESELREGRVNSYRTLFETAWNEFWKDGVISPEEEKKLEEIRKKYRSARQELDDYNKSVEDQKEALETLNSMLETSSTNSAQRESVNAYLAQGQSEEEANLRYEWDQAIEQMTDYFNTLANDEGYAEINGELMTLADVLAIINKDYQEQIQIIKDQIQAEKDKQAEEERTAKATEASKTFEEVLKGIADKDWETNRRNRLVEKGLTFHNGTSYDTLSDAQMDAYIEYAKVIKELNSCVNDLERSTNDAGEKIYKVGEDWYTMAEINEMLTNDIIADIEEIAEKEREEAEKTKEALRQAGWQEVGGQLASSTGLFGSAVSKFSDDQGTVLSDILSVLLEVLQTSENWGEVTEIFNELFAPLLPLVNMILYTLKSLEPVFNFIAKLIGGVAMVVNGIFAGINYVIDFFQWFFDWIPKAFHNLGEVIAHPFNASNRNLEELPKLNDYFQETSDQYWKTSDEIKASLDGIEKNTAKETDISAYKEMADAGMITASEFNALVAKKLGSGNYDQLYTYEGSSWKNGSGGTTIVYTGDMKFTIEGTNLSAEEIAVAVTKQQEKWTRTGEYA